MEFTAETHVAPKTVPCTTPSGGKPMQLSSTSSKVIMPSCVRTMPQVTKIIVPVAPPVMSVSHPRIPTLGWLYFLSTVDFSLRLKGALFFYTESRSCGNYWEEVD